MKKMLFSLLAMAFILASCSNSAGGAATGGLDGGTPTGGTPVGTGGDPTTNVPVLIGASNLIYIGEGQETVDSTAYTVKKYADVMVDNPYFYTYYKLYYLNGKLRRVYQFEHGIGCAMDYKYTEFVEHVCSNHLIQPFSINGTVCTINSKIITYSENGKTNYFVGYLHGSEVVRVNYDNDKLKECIFFSDGVEFSKYVYTYYDNGSNKSVTQSNNGKPYMETHYYPSSQSGLQGKIKLLALYTGDSLSSFYYNYESGFFKYYLTYSGSTYTLYTFADNTCSQSTLNMSSATSTETYTLDQAKAKLAELKNN